MLFLKIYIGFSILTFIILMMESYMITKQLKRKYPELVKEYKQNNKKNALEVIFSYIKTFVSCFVPIINIAILYVSLFDREEMEEKSLNKIKGL